MKLVKELPPMSAGIVRVILLHLECAEEGCTKRASWFADDSIDEHEPIINGYCLEHVEAAVRLCIYG